VEKNIKKEMTKLKKELYEKKEEIRDINELINKDIDGKLHSPLEDFSERELESLLDEQHSFLAKSVNSVPEKMVITSHRKIIGKPIIWIKRRLLNVVSAYAYVRPIMDKQTAFNQKCVELYRTLILHQKKFRKKINHIEESVSECEAHLDIISKKLKELDSKFEQNE
jgi:hypothetical protein